MAADQKRAWSAASGVVRWSERDQASKVCRSIERLNFDPGPLKRPFVGKHHVPRRIDLHEFEATLKFVAGAIEGNGFTNLGGAEEGAGWLSFAKNQYKAEPQGMALKSAGTSLGSQALPPRSTRPVWQALRWLSRWPNPPG